MNIDAPKLPHESEKLWKLRVCLSLAKDEYGIYIYQENYHEIRSRAINEKWKILMIPDTDSIIFNNSQIEYRYVNGQLLMKQSETPTEK